MARDPPTVIRCMTGSIAVMRLDQTLGVSRHVACASGCKSKRTSLEEGFKLHRFAGILPEQFLTEAGRHREAVVATDQRMAIRCFGDDLAGFVHDVSHVPPPIQRAGLDRALVQAIHPNMARWADGSSCMYARPTDRGHALHYAVRFRYSIERHPLSAPAFMLSREGFQTIFGVPLRPSLHCRDIPGGHAELKEIVNDILQDDRRASEVIRRMRSLPKKAPFELKNVDLNDVVRETLGALSSLAIGRKVELTSLITQNALPILGDRTRRLQPMSTVSPLIRRHGLP